MSVFDFFNVKYFVKKAQESGFTDEEILWILIEYKKTFLSLSRRPTIPHNLVLNILKAKVDMVIEAKQIVGELLDDLGIKTEKV